MLTINSTKKLNNGIEIPRFGFGVWRANSGKETENAVLWALEKGYKHIDTASFYKNEQDVGAALIKSGINRKDVFLTTKLWNAEMRAGKQIESFEESLEKLKVDYVDLYLLHWPVENFMESWYCLEQIYKSGRARAIGVSNFKAHHLKEILERGTIVPATDQMEFSPYMQDNETINFCNEHGIVYEAWSPLGAGKWLMDETLSKIAEKYNKTSAQVILRWVLQRDIIVFPKSVHKQRIIENANIFDFELDESDMSRINALNAGIRVGSDPDTFDF